MPRRRGTHTAAATVIGRLLILIASGKETSASLAKKLDLSPRQINRYIRQVIDAGWKIERIGAWTRQDYHLALKSPELLVAHRKSQRRSKTKQK